MTSARAVHPEPHLDVGCVLARELGVLVVWTDNGPVRATYGARMLGRVARGLSLAPEPGEWVGLRRWSDGPVTVEHAWTRPAAPALARVLPLRSPRRAVSARRAGH